MRRRTMLVLTAAIAAIPAATAQAVHFAPWGDVAKIDTVAGNHPDLNTDSLDGCPIESPDGRDLYMASNRPGGQGGLDIWVAHRDDPDAPYGAPQNLGPAINSAANDFCPTPVRGGGLFFVSNRATPGACGMGDIFLTRRNPRHGWSEPDRLACAPAGPNSGLDEQGPSRSGGELYFSRSAPGVPGEIFVSEEKGGGYGPAVPVAGLNDPLANDIQPNVRKDGREVVFSSNRDGAQGQDIYASTREAGGGWSEPENLGPPVNTSAAETRPSLSWHADRLLFGRAPGPEGMADIHLATRER
jgi:hypothetical protein